MTMLIEDLQDEIKNEGKAEEETQIEYESEMDKAKQLKGELEDKVVSLDETIAKREEDKTGEHADMAENSKENMDELGEGQD